MDEEVLDIHQLWYKLNNYLKKWYFKLKPGFIIVNGKFVEGKRKYKTADIEKVTGYTAMGRMDKFCRENPDIKWAGCDDTLFTGSTLYFVPHKDKDKYWGTTVIYVPQNGDNNNFFLYPDHLKNMIKVLTEIDNEYEKLKEEKNNEKR